MRLRSALVALALVLSVAGCGDDPGRSSAPPAPADFTGSGFGACPAPSGPAASGPLRGIALTCMDGSGQEHPLDRPTGAPTVVNLWASWCPPCGKELPAFQRLHEAAAGRVAVLGVVSEDSPTVSVRAGRDIGLTFPQLYDRGGRVRSALGRNALPVTVFLDASGAVRHVYNGTPLDDAALRALVAQHLGLALR